MPRRKKIIIFSFFSLLNKPIYRYRIYKSILQCNLNDIWPDIIKRIHRKCKPFELMRITTRSRDNNVQALYMEKRRAEMIHKMLLSSNIVSRVLSTHLCALRDSSNLQRSTIPMKWNSARTKYRTRVYENERA